MPKVCVSSTVHGHREKTSWVFLLVPDTRLSLSRRASLVRGHSGPVSMYNMNWVTYSFMQMRHVSMLGTVGGGGGQFVGTAHVMQ